MKVGKTLSYGSGRLDDGKAIAELGFEVKYLFLSGNCVTISHSVVETWFLYMQIGDYLDVAIL